MKYFYRILLAVYAFAIISCNEEKPTPALNKAEISFNEKLSSISNDKAEDYLYYIGTENGNIYVYNSDNNHIDTVRTDFDRIYKVVRDTKDKNCFWIGTRNGGLRKCVLRDGRMADINDGYKLGNKSTMYSCYDISQYAPYVYMATSQGLFAINEETDSLCVIYSKGNAYDGNTEVPPLSVTHITEYMDSVLYCTSESGIIKIDITADPLRYKPTAIMEKTSKVIMRDSLACFFSLAQGKLIMTDVGIDRITNSISTGLKDVQQYYHTSGVAYFIGSSQISIVEDSLLNDPKQYKIIPLHRRPRTDCYNVIEDDGKHGQSLLVTENALIRIAHNQNVFNTVGEVTYTCIDKDNIFILVDGKKIFKLDKGTNNAKQVYTLPHDRKAQQMTFSDGMLYYVDMQRHVYKVKLRDSFYMNTLFSSEDIVTDTIKRRITTITSYRGMTFVGVQDGIVCLSEQRKEQAKNIESALATSYITRFTNIGDSLLYISTLNDGIFVAKGDSPTLQRIAVGISFIRDIATKNDDLYFLTNHKLYRQTADSLSVINDDASGYSRLYILADGNLLGVGEFGVMDFTDSITYFSDIQFNSNACLVDSGRFYIGGAGGMLSMDRLSNRPQSIEMTSMSGLFTRNKVLFLATILLVILLASWMCERYMMGRRFINSYKKGLLLRIDELNSVREYFDLNTQTKIDKLFASVEQVDIGGKAESLKRLRKISLDIMAQTESAPSQLTKKLREQRDQMKSSAMESAKSYIENTDEAISTHTLLRMGGQIKANTEWLRNSRKVDQQLADLESMAANFISIKGVSDRLIEVLQSAKDSEAKLAEAEQCVARLDTAEVKDNLRAYIAERITTCKYGGEEEEDGVKQTIFYDLQGAYQRIENVLDKEAEVVDIMKQLPAIDRDLKIIQTISSLGILIESFFNLSSKIVNIDRELNNAKHYAHMLPETADRLRGEAQKRQNSIKNERSSVVDEILTTIDDFYDNVSKSHGQELVDIIGLKMKKGEGHFLQANVLALMLADVVTPVSRFKDILCANDQRIRSAKRDLVKVISKNRSVIEHFTDRHYCSFAPLLLRIAKDEQRTFSDDDA